MSGVDTLCLHIPLSGIRTTKVNILTAVLKGKNLDVGSCLKLFFYLNVN